MKQTRKIFVLNGFSFAEEEILLKELNFKALTVFYKKDISLEELVTVFKHNKSALCISCNLPGNFFEKAIKVTNFKFDADIVNQFQKIASLNNCDIGDHKSNSSGLKGTPTIADCAYCNYIKGLLKEPHHKILYSSDNFFVICTLGQFIYGYLLIIPYNHIISKYCSDSYLLIQDSQSVWKICQDSNLYIPRQYVRQLLAEEYHIPGECWNWRTHPYFDKMSLTDKQIISMLKENWDKLPQRIKNRVKNHL